MQQQIWVFHGVNGKFSSGVFSSRANAEKWIALHKLSGILTAYPLDEGVYDWCLAKGYFKPQQEKHRKPQFIQAFSSASQEHYHYEAGKQD